jgi:hypothetical protein
MVRPSAMSLFVACAAGLYFPFASEKAVAADPPYVILLRSRSAIVTPEKSRDAQTGGGFVQVTQLEPNVIMALMRGAVATGAGHKEGSASMQFDLNQDFEIVPTRATTHPPRLVVSGWLLGALDSTEPEGGTADQSPACAAIQSAGQPILNLCLKPHSVASGQNLFINDRVGPLEQIVAPGGFCLHQTFAINAMQPKNHCHPGNAASDFDPEPKLDPHWNYVLKPFRAVPHKDFGFRVILRVVEDVPPPALVTPPALLHPPGKVEKEAAAPILDRKGASR